MVGNAGSSRTLGFELSATQRLWSSLRAHLNYSLTDARFTGDDQQRKVLRPLHPAMPIAVCSRRTIPLSRHLHSWARSVPLASEIYWREDNTTPESLQSTLRARLGLSYDRYRLALWGANPRIIATVFQAASPLGPSFPGFGLVPSVSTLGEVLNHPPSPLPSTVLRTGRAEVFIFPI